MATSGTVSQTVFNTGKVIDHAFRRCRLVPQQITGEHIETAKDLLYLFMSTLVNKGIKLWNVDQIILPLYTDEYFVATPVGTVDLLNANLRTQNRLSEGTATATEGTAANAFDADLSTACTQTSPDGSITLQLSEGNNVTTFGLLPNVTETWTFSFQGSDDGITFDTFFTQTLPVVAGDWIWLDLQGVTTSTYFRLLASNGTILDVTELVFQNTPQEIPLAQLNRDDWSNLPNKTRTGRPTQYWWDKTRLDPIISIWPNVEFQFTFAQLTCFIQRHIEDVGTMTQDLEIPQRWYMAIVTNLAEQLGMEIKEVDPALIPMLKSKAKFELDAAWAGESDGSTWYLRPNISPYTR